MTNVWICWIYQYGVGGLVFFGTLVLALRAGALRLEQAIDRRLLTLLVAGYFLMAALHGVWIVAVEQGTKHASEGKTTTLDIPSEVPPGQPVADSGPDTFFVSQRG
jgi:uncharacterized membrane protein